MRDEASHTPMKELSAGLASKLEYESQSLVPGLFQGLGEGGRSVLLEVACEPDSLISSAVQDLTGRENAASRASIWNGCDLSCAAGVKLVLQRLDLGRPSNVWIATPCGPFSPLQHTNARTETQRQELQEKNNTPCAFTPELPLCSDNAWPEAST